MVAETDTSRRLTSRDSHPGVRADALIAQNVAWVQLFCGVNARRAHGRPRLASGTPPIFRATKRSDNKDSETFLKKRA